jgi:hypothetical protein
MKITLKRVGKTVVMTTPSNRWREEWKFESINQAQTFLLKLTKKHIRVSVIKNGRTK